jgi:hypothetical protein
MNIESVENIYLAAFEKENPTELDIDVCLISLSDKPKWCRSCKDPSRAMTMVSVDMYGLARHPFGGRLDGKDDVHEPERARYSAQAAYSSACPADW